MSHDKPIISVPHSSGSTWQVHRVCNHCFVPFMCSCAEMDRRNRSGWKVTFFVVWMFFQVDMFSVMAYLVFSHSGIKRRMFGGEGERMILELSWSFTSLPSYISVVTTFAASIKLKEKKSARVFSWLPFNLCFVLCLVWMPSRSVECRYLYIEV